MAQVSVYNISGESNGTMEILDSVFGVATNQATIHQVYTAHLANQREPWADTKNRGEVRGGGKKPWQQKGTGRARHGSIRSPIWKGGGVTFGPLSTRNYKQKINKKMNQAAVRMLLTDKVKHEHFVVVDGAISAVKTKDFSLFRKKLPHAGRATLMLTDTRDENLLRTSSNVGKVTVKQAKDVNVVDLMHATMIIATKKSIRTLEERLS